MPRKAPNPLAVLEAEREHQLHLQRLQRVKPNTDVKRPACMDLVHLQYNFKRHQQLQGVHRVLLVVLAPAPMRFRHCTPLWAP